jgi:hypothetical protein
MINIYLLNTIIFFSIDISFHYRYGKNMARKKMAVPKKLCGFRLSVDLIKKLKILAIEQNRPANLLLEEAIQGLLTRYVNNERQEE